MTASRPSRTNAANGTRSLAASSARGRPSTGTSKCESAATKPCPAPSMPSTTGPRSSESAFIVGGVLRGLLAIAQMGDGVHKTLVVPAKSGNDGEIVIYFDGVQR